MKYKLASPEDFKESGDRYVYRLADAYNKCFFDMIELLVGIDSVIDSLSGSNPREEMRPFEAEWGMKHLKKMQAQFHNPKHIDKDDTKKEAQV